MMDPAIGAQPEGRHRVRLRLFGLVITAVLEAVCVPPTAPRANPGPSAEVDSRVAAAVARDRPRVLVELRIPGGVRPEGDLKVSDRIAVQRQPALPHRGRFV